MSEVIVRVYEGEAVPEGLTLKRVIGAYDEPTGAGTNMRRRYVIVCDKPIELISKAEAPVAAGAPDAAPRPQSPAKEKESCDSE